MDEFDYAMMTGERQPKIKTEELEPVTVPKKALSFKIGSLFRGLLPNDAAN